MDLSERGSSQGSIVTLSSPGYHLRLEPDQRDEDREEGMAFLPSARSLRGLPAELVVSFMLRMS